MTGGSMKRRCVLDFAALDTVEAIYDTLADQLRLPAHFGRNLDALWDTLTTDLPGPIEIVLANESAAKPAMRPFLRRLAALLHEAAERRDDLLVTED